MLPVLVEESTWSECMYDLHVSTVFCFVSVALGFQRFVVSNARSLRRLVRFLGQHSVSSSQMEEMAIGTFNVTRKLPVVKRNMDCRANFQYVDGLSGAVAHLIVLQT